MIQIRKFNFSAVIIIMIFSQSCSSKLKTISPINELDYKSKITKLNKDNFYLLEGIYQSKDSSKHAVFWNKAFLKEDFFKSKSDSQINKFQIQFINERKIKLSFLKRNKSIESKIIKGKLKDGLFIFKRQVEIKGIPPLFWAHFDQISAIGIFEEKKLILFVNSTGMVYMIGPMMPSPTGDFHGPFTYKKIEGTILEKETNE